MTIHNREGVKSMDESEKYQIQIEGHAADHGAVRVATTEYLAKLRALGEAEGGMQSAAELHGTTDPRSTQGGE